MIDYKIEFKLKHDEVPAKINARTGEVKQLTKKANNIPDDSEFFQKESSFKKEYVNAWKFLSKYLTDKEYVVAHTLGTLAKANTNSLEPLNDQTTINDLMKVLNVSKNLITPILNKLFLLGVYGKFEISIPEKPYTRYWIFNPYLSFSGKLIKSDIPRLFDLTYCAKAHIDRNFLLTDKVIKELNLKKTL
jgi:hypothetical protein